MGWLCFSWVQIFSLVRWARLLFFLWLAVNETGSWISFPLWLSLPLKKAELNTAGSEVTSGSGLTDWGVFPEKRHRSDLFRKLERRGNTRLNMVCWYRIRCYCTWQVSPEGRSRSCYRYVGFFFLVCSKGRSVRVDRIEYDITRKSVVSLANVCDSRTKEFN